MALSCVALPVHGCILTFFSTMVQVEDWAPPLPLYKLALEVKWHRFKAAWPALFASPHTDAPFPLSLPPGAVGLLVFAPPRGLGRAAYGSFSRTLGSAAALYL